MHGYAPYVWGAYGFTLVVIAGNAWWARKTHLDALRRARNLGASDRPRRQPTVRELP
jgi:heme exporter protein CcmD